MGWLGWAEFTGFVIILAVLVPLLVLFLRRRWLSQSGAVDCSWHRDPGSRAAWVLGVARYRGEKFEWFRALSPSFKPDKTLRKGEWHVAEQRQPDAVEAVVLYADQRVVALQNRSGERLELALEPGSVTGLLSWLESAAPGTAHYGNTVA